MTSPALKITAGVAGGYLLGRRRKMRLAVGLGAYLLGKKITTSPTALASTAFKSLQEMPEFAQLSEAVRGELANAGRNAAGGVLSQRLESLSDALSERTKSLEGGQGGEQDEPDEDGGDRAARGKAKSRGGRRDAESERDEGDRDDASRDEYDEDDRDRDEIDVRDRDEDDRDRDDDRDRERGEYDDEDEPYPDEVDVRDAPRDEDADARDSDSEPERDEGSDGGTQRSSGRRRREPAHR